MQDYQYELAETNAELPRGYKAIKPEDIDKIDNCTTFEELDDHYDYFQGWIIRNLMLQLRLPVSSTQRTPRTSTIGGGSLFQKIIGTFGSGFW